MQLQTTYHSNNYPIIVEHHAISYLSDYIQEYDKAFLIIDEYVDFNFKQQFEPLLKSPNVYKLVMPAGEKMKTFEHYQQTLEQLLSYNVTRNTCLLAIGGGATGDLTGFLAATLLRGVDFIQVPTTILAHDSSVGGKVGINSSHVKNLIGAFYRPKAVIYDLDFLQTLPYEEVLSGYAEIYKHALLTGQVAVDDIEKHFSTKEKLQSLEEMDQFIFKGIKTKLNIIIKDEKEHNMRKYLNLGHTLGHAIEYKYKIPHGHAIMIGIIYQFIISNEVMGAQFDTHHFANYIKELHYPTSIVETLDFEEMYHYMLLDKKNDEQGIQMVLLEALGKPHVRHVEKNVLITAFNELQSLLK
ncbi:3-dehydroquinate synthase [Staphylococcus caledonicus]|uniref:3-dehydroquinate synthase n=1 Tax=Staphylococcus caledonicus TaxID=2741333 RepID=UPI0018E4C015|nr:3-dehydroquinate synthase [Staphylococcus caledonicus]MBI5972515.1 3-dehydroquinate synthase [Staphylococcus caledonicus]